MIIKDLIEINSKEILFDSSCKIYKIHVIIDNVEERAKEMVNIISSTSWITKLSSVEAASYSARAKRTIEKLVNEIFEKVSTQISTDFGEYMISMTAQDVLENSFSHRKVPLAELFKEKVSGNPGFDFHTESPSSIIAFGEAKYSGTENPYTKALTQIAGFIDMGKDIMELVDLKNFVSGAAIQAAIVNNKAFVAAFSLNAKNPDFIFKNILCSKDILPLLKYPELYLIGVEIHDSGDTTSAS